MRSITGKWIVSLLLTSSISVLLVGFVALRTTETQFNQFIADQALENFVEVVSFYYERNGSLQGFERWYGDSGRRAAQSGAGPPRPAFGLLDAEGGIVIRGSNEGNNPPNRDRDNDNDRRPAEPAQQLPIELSGQTIGFALYSDNQPELEPLALAFVERTTNALWVGIISAAVLALILGVALARSLTRPLRELTTTIDAMRPGELGQQVAVHTRDEIGDLATAFNQMSRDLAQSNQLRKQMTADIAHELRTPLTVINGYLEGLRDGTLAPTPTRFDTMYQEAAQLQHLIDDLRTLSLADAGELTLNKQPIAPESMLLQVAQSFQPIADQEGIQLRVNVEDDLPYLQLDRERMTQVLSNLVSNALRYTPAQGYVTLAAKRTTKGVGLSVQDTGAGIPAEKLPHIFERFYRVEASRFQDEGSESGLGLAIARSIVSAHGGTIHAESALGQGTTMLINLPR